MSKYSYKKYKTVKEATKHLRYRGYPIASVIGSYVAGKVWREKWSLKNELFRILLQPQFNLLCDSKKVLVTYRIDRQDYLDLLKLYTGDKITAQKLDEPNYVNFTFHNLLSSFFYTIKAFSLLLIYRVNIRSFTFIFSNVVFALRVIDYLEKRKWACKSYFAFNSSHGLESFLSYYFRKKGIKTYSFQHAAYYKYENIIPKDIINYENVCANTLLVWGSYTCEIIEEFLPANTKCLIYGYPGVTSEVIAEKKKKDDRILVALPRKIYFEESVKLLESLASTKHKFLIRPHPSIRESVEILLSNKKFKNFEIDLTASLKCQLRRFKFCAVISFNSTVLFQSILFGQNVILYRTTKNEFTISGLSEVREKDDLDKELRILVNSSPNNRENLKRRLFAQIDHDLIND